MLNKKLFEALNKIYEARILRTIDNKLWLSIASTCSRNKSTDAENIKPLKNATKEILLPRYVAALLIMKKPCPNNENDIENIKTFKYVGKKLIELGCTFEEIKQLYINNGGKVNINIKEETKELNKELSEPIKKQVTIEKTDIVKDNKPDIKPIPTDIKSYDDMLLYVNEKYTDVKNICNDIYELLETTYFTISKTFYKVDNGNSKIYFKNIDINEGYKVYVRNSRLISIEYVLISKKDMVEGTMDIIVNDMTINGNHITNNIKIGTDISGNDLTITYDMFEELMKIALAKLLYVALGKILNPLLLNSNKKIKKSYGSFDDKPRDFNLLPDTNEYAKILLFILKKLTVKLAYELLLRLLKDYKLGNKNNGTAFICLVPIKRITSINAKARYISVKGYNANNFDGNGSFIVIAGNNSSKIETKIRATVASWSDKGIVRGDWLNPNKSLREYMITGSLLHEILYRTLAYVLYYANNYRNLIK